VKISMPAAIDGTLKAIHAFLKLRYCIFMNL